jgi:hypothetical protein
LVFPGSGKRVKIIKRSGRAAGIGFLLEVVSKPQIRFEGKASRNIGSGAYT